MTLVFHDHLNPDNKVYIESSQIVGVSPFGSGSSITAGGTIYGVHENPEEVEKIRQGA